MPCCGLIMFHYLHKYKNSTFPHFSSQQFTYCCLLSLSTTRRHLQGHGQSSATRGQGSPGGHGNGKSLTDIKKALQVQRADEKGQLVRNLGVQLRRALRDSYVLSMCHVQHEGWMKKRPVKGLGGHKNRYFVLQKGMLRYYTDESKELSKLKGFLKLTVRGVVLNTDMALAYTTIGDGSLF